MCSMLKNPTAEWPFVPSKDHILQPFTCNGDVSIWVKILEWDEKAQMNKQTKYIS